MLIGVMEGNIEGDLVRKTGWDRVAGREGLGLVMVWVGEVCEWGFLIYKVEWGEDREGEG